MHFTLCLRRQTHLDDCISMVSVTLLAHTVFRELKVMHLQLAPNESGYYQCRSVGLSDAGAWALSGMESVKVFSVTPEHRHFSTTRMPNVSITAKYLM